jgi:hypothetical protein
MLSTLGEIVRDLLIAVGVIVVLLVATVIALVKMPAGNPLKRLLTALCFRLGATALAGILAIPIEPIPGLDALYDVGAPLLLLVYWVSFFMSAHHHIGASSDGAVSGIREDRQRRSRLPPLRE